MLDTGWKNVRSIYLFIFVVGCAPDSPEPLVPALLTTQAGWTSVLTIEDGAPSHEFDGMRLQFSPTDFSTSMVGNLVWPAHGEYILEDQSSHILLRSDGTEIFISRIDQHTLTLEFTYRDNEPISARMRPRTFRFIFQPSK